MEDESVLKTLHTNTGCCKHPHTRRHQTKDSQVKETTWGILVQRHVDQEQVQLPVQHVGRNQQGAHEVRKQDVLRSHPHQHVSVKLGVVVQLRKHVLQRKLGVNPIVVDCYNAFAF